MQDIFRNALLVLSVLLVVIGIFLLPAGSLRRKRLLKFFIFSGICLLLVYGGLLAVNLSSNRGDFSLFFLKTPLETINQGGEMSFTFMTNPPRSGEIGLAIFFGIGLLLITIIKRKAAVPAVILWSALGCALFSLTRWGGKHFLHYWISCGGGVLLLIAGSIISRKKKTESRTVNRKLILTALSLILALGFLLRFYKLDISPPSFLDYEGTTGLSGIEVLEGNREYFSILWRFLARPIMNNYSIPFFAFPLGLFFRVFGVSIITLRSLTALLGTLSPLAIYLLVRARAPRNLALLSAFFLALCPWHITISRVGMALILTPLYVMLIGWLLLRAFSSHQARYYIMAGVGVGIYWLFYMVGKVILPVLGLLLLQKVFLERRFLRKNWKGLVLFFLVIFIIASLSAMGPKQWLLGTGKQSRNFIWYQKGPQAVYTPNINLDWAWKYFILNIRKSFRYLFIRSHHEFLLPSMLPFLNPLLFPFFILGLGYSLFNWKKDLYFFFLALFVCAFIPQVIFPIWSDKAAPRHLMLLIPPACFFAAQPFFLFIQALKKGKGRQGLLPSSIIIIPIILVIIASSFYITFSSSHWVYPRYERRRSCASFIRERLNDYYFYIVRFPGQLYETNRVIDFITYPLVRNLHYHLSYDYPHAGRPGEGIREKYSYISSNELQNNLDKFLERWKKVGFVFEDPKLIPFFESRFGQDAVKKHPYRKWPSYIYYTFLYPPGKERAAE